MKNLTAIPTLLVCAALTLVAASVGARSTDAPACVVHSHTISDPDPADCPFCGGNPQVHVRALWAIEKQVVNAYVMRLL